MIAFKYNGTVVIDKAMIQNAKVDEFEEVTLIISRDDIREWYEELALIGLIGDEDIENE